MMPAARSRGFTLLEVLVALAVLALALGALLRSAGGFAANQGYLRDRTFADWVARDVLTSQQLQPEWPAVGRQQGHVEFAGREWDWTLKVSTTQDPDLRRLDVDVRFPDADGKQAPLASLSGFVGQTP